MKNFRLLLLSTLACFLTVSCTDEDLNDTWHADKGLVTIITDWGESKDAYWTMPYTIKYGQGGNLTDYTAHGLVESLPLQTPGLYNIEILNSGDGFSVQGDVVTIDQDEVLGESFIKSNPAYLYTARTSVEAVKDRNTTKKVGMTIQMRKLIVRIYLRNDPTIYTSDNPSGFKRPVKAVRAKMSGVAKSMDFIQGVYDGSFFVDLPFVVRNTIAEGRFLEASVVLLGVNDDHQILNLEVDFDYGENLRPEEFDFHNQLLTFNDDKSEAHIIRADIRMVLNAEGQATIEPYDPQSEDITVDEGGIDYAIGDIYPKHDPTRPLGAVIWTTDDQKHGIIMSGYDSETAVNWGPVAELLGTMTTSGIRNTAGMTVYINDNDQGYNQADFGAYDWLMTTYRNDAKWFIPSADEILLLNKIDPAEWPTINANLTAAGFTAFDQTATYWTSQSIRGEETDPSTWTTPDIPEYEPSTVYIWTAGNITAEETHVTDTEGDPVLHKVRALRFF